MKYRYCLALVIPSLGAGGAERVLTLLANHWVGQGHVVHLITLTEDNQKPFFPLDERVTLHSLGVERASRFAMDALSRNLAAIISLRRCISRIAPDRVLSFIDRMNALTLLATRGLDIPVYISERVDPQLYSPGRIWEFIRRHTYRWANGLAVQTQNIAHELAHLIRAESIHVIPNPVSRAPAAGQRRESGERSVIAMGRLAHQKGFDLLITAFGRVANEYANWKLVILGEGPDRSNLEQQIRSLGLEARITMPGCVTTPVHHLQASDIFVLPSRFEGFPNALCEAMAAGLPVIATDCPGGSSEIVRSGTDGILIPPENVDALVDALRELMATPEKCLAYGRAAVHIVDRFNLSAVAARWEMFLGMGPNS